MTKLKLGPLPDDKPVKVTLELPAPLHRDLVAYAEVLARESGQPAADPIRLIVLCWSGSSPRIAASPRPGEPQVRYDRFGLYSARTAWFVNSPNRPFEGHPDFRPE